MGALSRRRPPLDFTTRRFARGNDPFTLAGNRHTVSGLPLIVGVICKFLFQGPIISAGLWGMIGNMQQDRGHKARLHAAGESRTLTPKRTGKSGRSHWEVTS
jgi:hypothetical protein